MEDENEYKKLPTEDKCVHKLWKARIAGYEEAIKLFNQIDDEKSPEWTKYLGLIKKFVTDSNAVAQEKGLEAALVFVENCGHAGKTTGEVMSGIVSKCIAAPKTKTKDLALQVTLMYVEIEKQDAVQEELMKGMEQKNPKVVAACISALTTALKQFGNKVITIKPMVKKIPILLADRDKGVRDEMKALVVEMHRWIGGAIEPHISSLQAVVQQEMRDAFGSGPPSQPSRYLRSQQQKMSAHAVRTVDDVDGANDDDDADTAGGDSADMDPYDIMDPVEILSKLPKDFYDNLEAKKWKDRKEALDALENLLKNAPRLEPGDYADLVRALKKIIAKDSNVMLVALAGRLLGMIASGLRAKFSPYAAACVQAILDKFKEKKTNVVATMRETIDIIYPITNLEAIMEDMLAAFNNKNPSIKSESALFLARALCHTQPAAFNKKLIKSYVPALLKLLDCAEPMVRDAAAEALGTATKLVGEKSIAPHIDKIDNLKEQKIKEFADKAVIQVKMPAPKKETKAKVAAPTAKGDTSKPAGSTQPKPVKRPNTVVKKTATKKPATATISPAREMELSSEEVDARAEALFAPDVIKGLVDANWKTRLTSVQGFYGTVQGLSPDTVTSQVLFRTLNKKPGLKDTNVQVLKARLEAVKYIAENFPVSTTAADFVVHDVVNKLGEALCTSISAECLTSLSEACNLEYIVNEALGYAMDSQKNPKVQSELFNWISNAIKEFGFTMNIKPLIAHSKKAVSATNPNVRTSSVNFLGILSLYVGPSLINHFDSEKPATKQLISLELDKYANNTPPTPTRMVTKSASKASMNEETEDPYDDAPEEEPAPVEDNRPRTDLAPLITETLIGEINNKNWKVRNEALDKLKAIISSSAPIKPSLGELPPALTARLVDSNSKLAQTALQICESLASAMGPKCKQHVRTFFPAFFQAFGDNKSYIRQAATSCVEAWCSAAGGAHVAFDGEMIHDALKTGSPVLRAELYQWVADHLPNLAPRSFAREELAAATGALFAALEDRAPDVRRAAAAAVLPFMLHLGYDAMHKHVDKLKPGSKTVVQAALDKARPMLPVQPLPTKNKKDEPRGVKSAGALKKEADKKGSAPGKAAKGPLKPASASNRGKKDDEDTSPLLPNNNAKNQRIVDDQKLKVLKWNFTTPREEFFDLLKEQMGSAGLNKQLVINMFHTDFRYHLKALESLSEDLHENGSALMANLDLVLKWLTLRFFDTNPSVILKGLEYLSQVFSYLMDSDYTMAEYEANCFIPYLVLKVGDPKDTVRNGVKALFRQICVVYSVTKLFGYLMEGLKSKNARQRAECLECIGHLVETYGASVLSGGALKELARHIGDRDNAVRSAALNCVASVYFLEGEKVYKMIGQISDKELSLLEERIKRAGKSRSAENRRSMVVPLSATGKPILPQEPSPTQEMNDSRRVISVDAVPGEDYEEEEPEEPPAPEQPAAVAPVPTALPGPYRLDPELIAKLDAQVPRVRRAPLPALDLRFLDEPVPLPTLPQLPQLPQLPPAHQRATLLPMSPPRHMSAPHSLLSHPQHAQISQPSIDDSQLADTIHSIASPDINAATRALSLVAGALGSRRGAALRPHEERLLAALAAQLRRMRTAPAASPVASSDDALHLYKCVAATLSAMYESGACAGGAGGAATQTALAALLEELLRVLGAAPDAERLVRVLNSVCVRLIEHADRTALLCSLVTLLHDSIGVTDPSCPRYQDLLMKCFWKTLKMIQMWDVNSIDYDSVLHKIHLFYSAYPNSFWKKNADSMSDTPYRTVKTLVHSLVKMKGASITDHLTQIPDMHESDLYLYLLKVFKQLKIEEKKDTGQENGTGMPSLGSNSALNAGRLPRSVHEELALILKRIGNKQHNQDALQQLYELRERHPEVDIWTFMQGSSFYFRNYVERGLRDVAERRRLGPASLHYKPVTLDDNIDINNENDDKSHVVFLERLRALQAKAGMKTESPASAPRTPVDNRVLTDSINENTLPRHSIDPQLQLHTAPVMSQRSEAAVDALRLKLQQIKSSAKR